MKIGVDYSSVIQKKTGIGSFAFQLIEELRSKSKDNEFVLYRPEGNRDLNTLSRIFWESIQLPRKAAKDKTSIFYSPGFSPPLYTHCPRVVTVHDLIGLIYPANVKPVARFYWTQWLPYQLKKAEVLVASSQSTKNDIVKLLGIAERRIRVVHLAANACYHKIPDVSLPDRVIKKYDIRGPFFISVSTLEPRKNHLRLLKAFDILNKRGKLGFLLVIAGKPAGAEDELYRFARDNGLSGHVRFLGYVSDEDLIYLYNAAMGYAMISLYEGFGLPVLEAMSCGLTGIISNNSSLPEIAGNTALLVDPADEIKIADAFQTLYENTALKNKMAQAAMDRSKEFSIENTASQMIDIFQNAL